MKCRLFLILFLTFYWHESSKSSHYVSSHDRSKRMFQKKMVDFANCSWNKSRHKPLQIIICLNGMKLESDPYWQVMVKNGLESLTPTETKLVKAIKVFQQISNLLEHKIVYEGTNWTQLKEVLEPDTESSGGSGYVGDSGPGRYGGYFYDDEEYYNYYDGGYERNPDGSGSGSGEGSGDTVKEKLPNLEEFRKDFHYIIDIFAGGPPYFEELSLEACSPPFVDVAYKVCVLPVLDRQLSWSDARLYCSIRKLELIMDSAVIKGRRYFNNLLGVEGSRERWTLWVGAKRNGQGKWLWNDDVAVPDFFWIGGQPRTHGPGLSLFGDCMALDGFADYFGEDRPCHLKRRFACQKVYT